MIAAILIGAALAAPLPASSDVVAEVCAELHAFSTYAMAARQRGDTFDTLFETFEDNAMFQEIALGAYRVPVFYDDTLQQIVVEEFALGVHEQCMLLGRDYANLYLGEPDR